MKILQAFRYKAEPDARQDALMGRIAGCCRVLRNTALEQRNLMYIQRRVSIHYEDQSSELKELKAAYPWLREAPHHSLQSALRDLENAFQRFFKGLSGYPQFKRKGEHDSFRFPDRTQIKLKECKGKKGRIFLPKIKDLSFVMHRPLLGEIRSVTVSREADGWYISILTEREVDDPLPVDNVCIGVDLGVKRSVTLSEHRGHFSVPGFTPGEQKRLVRLQQQLARQKKGSRSRSKTKQKIALLHLKVSRRREDALHRLSFHMANSHSHVFVEALKVSHMTRSARGTPENPGKKVRQKAGLNRSILAQGWGIFREQLKYKCPWYGSKYQEVEPAFSSQECSRCGHVAAENRKSQADFLCVLCGHADNADNNAADVILARGIRVTAGGALRSQAGDEAGISARLQSPSEAPPVREG